MYITMLCWQMLTFSVHVPQVCERLDQSWIPTQEAYNHMHVIYVHVQDCTLYEECMHVHLKACLYLFLCLALSAIHVHVWLYWCMLIDILELKNGALLTISHQGSSIHVGRDQNPSKHRVDKYEQVNSSLSTHFQHNYILYLSCSVSCTVRVPYM